MSKIWKLYPDRSGNRERLSEELGIHPIVAQLLVNRGIEDTREARDFLQADLTALHDPFELKDMDRAVARINQAVRDREKVLVYGDYDVDGVLSSVILNRLLTSLGLEVVHHIPHRMREGYGLNHDIAESARAQDVNLMITIDCGITARAEVETIQANGIDVIVVDHHEPPEDGVPPAAAVIDPKRTDCSYPFKELASVGLALKLVQALRPDLVEDVLDLAAVGTVADVVPLRGENRVMVKNGLQRVNATPNAGLRALLANAKLTKKRITPFHVGFILGPRINAAGRMGSAHTSLDLFLSQEDSLAGEIAKELESHNQDRQRMQNNIISEAMAIVEEQVNFKDEKVIVLKKEGWHKGVLGIVASRLTDRYYRPSIVISTRGGIGTASCRSIDGFHIHNALSACQEMLVTFGGHEGAAGLTIKEEFIETFRTMINEVAAKTLELKKLTPTLAIDCEIPLASIDEALVQTIDELQPYGEGNPSPVFCTRGVEVKSYPQIMGKGTLKFWVQQGEKAISAIGFGMERFAGLISPGGRVDLAYEMAIDDWNKAPQAQLRLKDIRLSE
ncbi:MAG: single-stranded-DNA-specific exonuclease RecJ [Candidatus Omnitrophica bacterium]|nr:single-stranded-DNA-specific exonuclease RecJ [Candidatus Omnitrophota bacterium]MCB9721348.1 single-stranded-DNA-specific exonuclease RecJ [Candidatus Omnitrophota bacterium]